VLDLIAFRKTRSTTAREYLGRAASRLGAVVADFRTSAAQSAVQAATGAVAEPTEAFAPESLPAVEDIEAAASMFFHAADQARTADRAKRKAKKILDRLMPGRYGAWDITREDSGRSVADLDEIKRIFKAHGLGPVPMRQSAPSLKVRKVELTSTTIQAPADPHQLCERHACEDCGTELDQCDMRHDEDADRWQCQNCADSPSDAAEYRRYTYAGAGR
jgi:hypothetical protein